MRWSRRVVRSGRSLRVVLAAAASAAAVAAFAPSAAVTSVNAEPGGVINIGLDAAPDVEGLVAVRLVLGGEDVTETYCGPGDPGLGAVLTCSGLPDGQYDVETTGVPDGLRTTVNCDDEVASRALTPLAVSGSSVPWLCTAFVGTPAVVLTVNGSLGDPTLDAGRLELVPVEGVTPDCVDDVQNDSPATRCRDLPLGTYEVRVTDVPDTAIVSSPLCESQIYGADLEYAIGPAATLTDERWLWWCDVDVRPPAVIGLVSTTGVQPDPDAVGLRVTGPEGDATSRCTFVGSSDQPGRSYWSCDLDVGGYTVAFDGLAAADVIESCESFEVTVGQDDPVRCLWTVRVTAVPPTTGVAPTTPDTVTGVLPATGRSSDLVVVLAVTVLLAGVVFVASARRPAR